MPHTMLTVRNRVWGREIKEWFTEVNGRLDRTCFSETKTENEETVIENKEPDQVTIE